MEPNKTKTLVWVIGGVVVAVIVIYIAVSGGVLLPRSGKTPTAEELGKVATTTRQGVVAAPGTSPIATSTGQVVTPTGEPVKLDVTPGSPKAPQQSNPIKADDLSAKAVELKVSAGGFLPSAFTVKEGQPVALAITATDSQTHVFYFKDQSLSAVAVGVGPGETRAIVFNAPKRGTYDFYCGVPGHEARGEIGRMTVE